ncbi:head-tail joining protein [Paludibaculum fermentans]|uniref:Uncharacterized protein n=1 Tax=Paludibaculum fermentans TaxID=1473598 RepID=A0A7S7SJK9_PALFE|nr:hypothetical protein [Paludibaculum fermentans]QOY88192.1 hypothetical protein IRI77_36565 [Paludibaculum fermentans]
MADWTSLLNGLNGTVLGSFGREVAYLPQTGSQAAIRGIFENTREAQENVPGVYAVLFVRLADFAQQPARGDEVLVDGVTYKVFDVEADTSGAVVLRLRQV